MLSSLYHSTITEHLRVLRVGDELRVDWDGAHWWASAPNGRVGRLSWSKGLRDRTTYVPDGRSPYDFDAGTLHVREVTVDTAGAVVDCGGYVVPDDFDPSDWPMVPLPDPADREFTVTMQSRASESTSHEEVPSSRPRTWLDRLLGR